MGKLVEYDFVGAIMAHEAGSLDENGTIELFQYMIDTDKLSLLQGCYGRAAQQLLNEGLIVMR